MRLGPLTALLLLIILVLASGTLSYNDAQVMEKMLADYERQQLEGGK